jgi:hypothetical protein
MVVGDQLTKIWAHPKGFQLLEKIRATMSKKLKRKRKLRQINNL